jgi:hypothetical protein
MAMNAILTNVDQSLRNVKFSHSAYLSFSKGHITLDKSAFERSENVASKRSTYHCPTFWDANSISATFKFQYEDPFEHTNNSTRRFNVTSFLTTMAGRTLSVIGDSLGLQLFQAIDIDLYPHLNSNISFDGNGTHDGYEIHNGKLVGQYGKHSTAATRRYTAAGHPNATLRFCRYPQFVSSERLFQGDLADFCLRKALLNDDDFQQHTELMGSRETGATSLIANEEYYYTHYLVIALGAWYKPSAHPSGISYDRKVIDGTAVLLRDLIELRYTLDQKLRRSTRIVWRLNTHMGPIDEISSAGYNPKSFPQHGNWRAWGDPAVEAKWVAVYNDVIRAVAQAYGDLILVSYFT